MASYNNGIVHESGKAIVRHIGHCIEVSRVETDTRELCWPLANYGEGLLPVASPTPPFSIQGLVFHWSGTSPLLSVDGNETVFSHDASIVSRNGRDALLLDADGQTLVNTTPGGVVPGNLAPDFAVIYMLLRTKKVTSNAGAIAIFDTGGGGAKMELEGRFAGTSISQGFYRNAIETLNPNNFGSFTNDVPTVVSVEWRGSTTDDVIQRSDELAGTPVSASFPDSACAPTDFKIQGTSSGAGDETAVWEVVLTKGFAFDPAVAAYLLGLLS
jgi:hypothetical protein